MKLERQDPRIRWDDGVIYSINNNYPCVISKVAERREKSLKRYDSNNNA